MEVRVRRSPFAALAAASLTASMAVAERANEPEASAQVLYATGLAERFRNHEGAAQADFRHALELDPLLWQARFELNRDLAARR